MDVCSMWAWWLDEGAHDEHMAQVNGGHALGMACMHTLEEGKAISLGASTHGKGGLAPHSLMPKSKKEAPP